MLVFEYLLSTVYILVSLIVLGVCGFMFTMVIAFWFLGFQFLKIWKRAGELSSGTFARMWAEIGEKLWLQRNK